MGHGEEQPLPQGQDWGEGRGAGWKRHGRQCHSWQQGWALLTLALTAAVSEAAALRSYPWCHQPRRARAPRAVPCPLRCREPGRRCAPNVNMAARLPGSATAAAIAPNGNLPAGERSSSCPTFAFLRSARYWQQKGRESRGPHRGMSGTQQLPRTEETGERRVPGQGSAGAAARGARAAGRGAADHPVPTE